MLKKDGSACRFIDGEAVLLNAETSAYYSMNQTGAFVLRELLVSGHGMADIEVSFTSKFGAQPATFDNDLRSLIEGLESEGLIVRGDGPFVAVEIEGAEEVGLPGTYEKPSLERHGELEQLILSGE